LAAAFPQLEILELIGQGGMGFVFKARQAKLERLVALKILPQSLAADPAFADRFTREGRVLARLNHPNIVTIHDFGQANGFFYLLMEFVDGVNLREAMRAGRFTPEQALAVVPRICDALQFAHNEGILHRDIKPENILLDSKGRIKIADFGIAKLVGEPHADVPLTATGGTLGTPHYMAPEQFEKPATVDHRADIYSLGVVFYEMLTGELPLGKFQPPSHKVQVDVRLDEVVLHALEKEPARRYQQVSEVKTAVDTIATIPPVGQRDHLPGERPRALANAGSTQKPDHFWRRFAIAVSLFIAALILLPMGVILLGILIPSYLKTRQAQNQEKQAQAAANEAAALIERQGVSPKPKLLIQSEKFTPVNPGPGRLDWGFKVFVPPDSLASILFVRWSNGVPTVDPGLSAYYKVGRAGGIDVPFCSVSCEPIPASQVAAMTNAENREMLGKWGFPGPAGSSNAVQWNVNLGLGFTSSKWMPMPSFHRMDASLPQGVEHGHQLSFPLVAFEQPAVGPSNGWSGVDLRIFVEPLRLPPIRTLPNEKDMTNYVGATGIAGTMEETLEAITGKPVSTAGFSKHPSVEFARASLFGPVTERVLNDVETGTNYLLDLDTGVVSTLPSSIKFDDVAGSEAWYRKAGIDVGGKSERSQIVSGRDLISEAVHADRLWENPSAEELNSFLERNRDVYAFPRSGLGNISFRNELPTCLFKTREGNVGVLQITGVIQNPRGVKLRYKLLREGENSSGPAAETSH
jgi:serine/threonine protein kinase